MSEPVYLHNDRWVVLADISGSTELFYLIKKHTKNQLYHRLTTHWNGVIEAIYHVAEFEIPEWATLANTMGDGFLIVGAPEHGGTRIGQEIPQVLISCINIKRETDAYLNNIAKNIQSHISSATGNEVVLPDLKLKVAVHYGHVIRSLGFNRYIGDCINYCSRLLGSLKENVDKECIALTDECFELLPEEVRRVARERSFATMLRIAYPSHRTESDVCVWRVPIPFKKVEAENGSFRHEVVGDSFWYKLMPYALKCQELRYGK